MATDAQRVEKYASWLVANKHRQDSEEFQTVAAAYKELRTGSSMPAATTGVPSKQNPAATDFGDIARGLWQGASFGFGDEISAMAKAGIGAATTGADYSRLYEENLEYERKALADFHKNNPVAAIATEIVGSMVTGGVVGGKLGVTRALAAKAAAAKAAGSGAVVANAVGTGVGLGAIGGGVYGAGTAEEGERLAGAAQGAAFGAGGGAIGGALGGTLGPKMMEMKAVKMANVVSKRAAKKMKDLGINRQEAVRRALEETGNQPEPFYAQLRKMGHSEKSAVDVSMEYWKNPAYVDKAAEYFKRKVIDSKYVAKPMEWFDNAVGRSLATQLEKIHPLLGGNLRRMEMYKHVMIGDQSTRVAMWRNGYKALDKKTRLKIDTMLMSGDRVGARAEMAKFANDTTVNKAIQKVAKRAQIDDAGNLLEEFDNRVVPMLDEYSNMLSFSKDRSAGSSFIELPDYFPRVIADEDGFRKSKWGVALRKANFDDLVKQKASDLKRPLTNAEKDDIMLKLLTKPEVKPITPKSRHELQRVIPKLDEEMAQYYMGADDALEAYIHNTTEVLAHRQFLGMSKVGSKYMNMASSVEGTSSMLNDMVSQGTLTFDEAERAMTLIQSRMGNGATNMAKILQQSKNFFYATTIANPYSAATQLGDTALSGALNGILNSVHSAGQVLAKGNRLPQLDASDLFDLVRHQEELITTNGFNRALTGLFKWSGFASVDKFGKNVNIRSTLNRAIKLAGREADVLEDPTKAIIKLRKEFGNSLFNDNEWADVARELVELGKQGGYAKAPSDNIKFMVWNRLSEAQPLSLSEMPKWYLDHPNGRVWYAMRSYALKQLDLIRKNATDLLVQPGRRLEGAKFLTTYGALLGTANVGIDKLKNFALGRDVDFLEWEKDEIGWAAFKGLGLSEYWAEQMTKSGYTRKNAIQGTLIPGAMQNMYDAVVEPITWAEKNIFDPTHIDKPKDLRWVRKIPYIGNGVFNHYLGGAEDWNRKTLKRKIKKIVDDAKDG